MVILPTKFVDELRNVPEEDLSSIKANIDVSRPNEIDVVQVLSADGYK